jgi:hypothetical protein
VTAGQLLSRAVTERPGLAEGRRGRRSTGYFGLDVAVSGGQPRV